MKGNNLKQSTMYDYFKMSGSQTNKNKSQQLKTSWSRKSSNSKEFIIRSPLFKKIKLPVPICSDESEEENEESLDKRLKKTDQVNKSKPSLNISVKSALKDKNKKNSAVSESEEGITPTQKRSRKRTDNAFVTTPNVPFKRLKESPKENGLSNKLNNTPKCSIKDSSYMTPTSTRKNNATSPHSLCSPSTPTSPSTSFTKPKSEFTTKRLKIFNDLLINLSYSSLWQLLNERDQKLMKSYFEGLRTNEECQYFVMQLFLYQPKWYNVHKFCSGQLSLDDKNILDFYHTAHELGMVDTDYTKEGIEVLLNLLTNAEIKDICKKFKISLLKSTNEELIGRLIKHCKTQPTLSGFGPTDVLKQRIKEKLGYCVKLSDDFRRAMTYSYILCTFTNEDLRFPMDFFKKMVYTFDQAFPEYEVECYAVFSSEQEFYEFAEAHLFISKLEKAIEKKRWDEVENVALEAFKKLQMTNLECKNIEKTKKSYHEKFNSKAQLTRCISKAIRHLPKIRHENKLKLLQHILNGPYCSYERGHWYAELALIQSKYLKQPEEGIKTIIKAFEEEKDLSEIDLLLLSERGKVLNKKSYNINQLYRDKLTEKLRELKVEFPTKEITGRPMKVGKEPGRKRLYTEEVPDGTVICNVESLAMQYYIDEEGYTKGEHCENILMNSLLLLLFWDIIYQHYVPGTFISKLQKYPLDLKTKYFYINRKNVIEKRLKEIEIEWSNEEIKRKIRDMWLEHSHEDALIKIEAFVKDPQLLVEIASCIERPILAKIMERLIKDYCNHRSGLPDLLLWNPHNKTSKFVEVKGENDVLSVQQNLWLNYLSKIGADAELCCVKSVKCKLNK